ncbi:MAG: protein kinase [Acidobacteria bacterium]|nr:protein kinase [Acidobacteriota bacterium]
MLSVGTQLGPYELISPIGAGGMGEVWRARDKRLEREVALKILPTEFASNAQLKLRFEREAKTISQLNHPHICVLHDVGEASLETRDSALAGDPSLEPRAPSLSYLVMELIDGESLAARIAKGPLPLPDVLKYGAQIAEALDRAHRAGVVHRDLKPGNVMITKSGAKLLDFGLAKSDIRLSLPGSSQPPVAVDEPTAFRPQEPLTAEGTILGTFQYMAPEQLEGIEADSRTDIFALGCVLYEMATGKRAFDGKTKTSLIAQIVSGEPRPIRNMQPLTPPALEHVIARCLEKDPDDRWQSAHDVASELKWISEAGSQAGAAVPIVRRRARRELTAWMLAAVAMIGGGISLFYSAMKSEPTLPVMRFAVPLAADPRVAEAYGNVVISPDGTRIVYVGRDGEASNLWIRKIGELDSIRLAGSQGASQPFFSPDGNWIGYFTRHQMWKLAVAGGVPVPVAKVAYARGGSWGDDGSIVYAPFYYSALMRISADHGTPEPVTELREAEGERNHRWPQMLPGSRSFIYTIGFGESFDEGVIVAQTFGSDERHVLVRGGFGARYLSSGHLVYMRKNSLYAVEFDPESLEVRGDSIPVLDGIANNLAGNGEYSVSTSGIIAYLPAGATFDEGGKLAMFDRGGNRLDVPLPDRQVWVRFSPSGDAIAGAPGYEIWSWDLKRGSASRITSEFRAYGPTWSPDGRRIAFGYEKDGPWAVYSRATDGSDLPAPLFDSGSPTVPSDWSPDGSKLLVMVSSAATSDDVGIVDLESGQMSWVVQTESSEIQAVFSPDGEWIAYCSDESGQWEVYIRNLHHGGRWQISTSGGGQPVWTYANEIFFKSGRRLLKVDVEMEPEFRASAATVVLEAPFSEFDISPDGQRIILVERAESGPTQDYLHVVVNWFDELKQRVKQ